MSQYVSEKTIQEAIEFFRKKEYGKPEQIGLYFFFKAMGVNIWSYTDYPKWGSMDEYQKRQVLRILYDLAGVFDVQKETGLKRTALFSFSIRKKYKAGAFYNGATPFQRLGSRVSDTLDNALVSTLLQRSSGTDEGIKLRDDSVENLLENYLKGNKISIEMMAAWYHRFWEIEIPQDATDKEFSDVCVLHLIKQLKLTSNDFDRLFFYNDKTIGHSSNMISGDSLRSFLAIDKDVEPEVSKDPSQDFMQMNMTIGSGEVSELLAQRGDALTEEAIRSILAENDNKVIAELPVQNDSLSEPESIQDEYSRAAEIIKKHLLEGSLQFDSSNEEISDFLYQFREKFSPLALSKLTDQNIRQEMFYTSEQTNDSLCYWLEFNSFSRKEFGSIAGGSAYKFGLFQRKEDGIWISGSPINTLELTEEESLQKAYSIRDKLIKGAEIIEGRTFDSVEDYKELEKKLKEEIGDFYTYGWVLKYFLLMYPESFTGFYWEGWQRHVLYALGIKPDASFLVRNGQIALVMKKTGLSAPHFGAAIYDKFGYVIQFVRIGTSDGEGNSCFDELIQKSVGAIGWADVGSLVEYDTGSSLNKTALAEKMQELYYPDDKRMASRKAGEISTFYSTNENTVFVAMDGEALLALGDKIGEYHYDSNSAFAHRKTVKWHRCFKQTDRLPNKSEGHLTTCKQLSDEDNAMFLYHKYYYDLEDTGEVSSSFASTSNNSQGNKQLKDYDGRKQVFIEWMKQKSKSGAPSPVNENDYYSENVIYNYAAFLTNRAAQLTDFPYEETNLFYYVDPVEFAAVMEAAMNAPNYPEVNQKCISKGFGHAMKRYKEFLEELHSVNDEEKKDTPNTKTLKSCLEISREPRENKIHPLNFIIYGAPGTGKTYSTAEYALAIIENRSVDVTRKSMAERKAVMKKYNNLVSRGQIVFTTFHQSYGYEEFIQGLRPNTESEHMSFKTVDGVFKRIADIALNDNENNYVVIIDEINRANISKVFGELITLIEEDKRWGEVNEICATLQSGDVFAVPNNLYIVGTMNSADKSISLIDAALRRRFEFIEQHPDKSLVDDPVLRGVMKKLNELLADTLESSDLLIGHSYFMGKDKDALCTIMNNSIIPLLYEYFYDNKKKVINVLDECLKGLDVEIKDDKISRVYVVKAETEAEV